MSDSIQTKLLINRDDFDKLLVNDIELVHRLYDNKHRWGEDGITFWGVTRNQIVLIQAAVKQPLRRRHAKS